MAKDLKLVVVEWLDAWTRPDDAVTMKDAKDTHRPEIVTTLGWVLYQDETGISLANEVYDGYYRGRSFIPSEMIHSITPYTLTKARVRREKTPSGNPAGLDEHRGSAKTT